MSHPELEFFNSIRGKLRIGLDLPAEPVPGLPLCRRAAPNARMIYLLLEPGIYDGEADEPRPLTQEELDSVAFRGLSIRLQGKGGVTVLHDAPNGSYFTVGELLRAVEETERQSRPKSEWDGGIDVDHVFFDGISPCPGDVWDICWGS